MILQLPYPVVQKMRMTRAKLAPTRKKAKMRMKKRKRRRRRKKLSLLGDLQDIAGGMKRMRGECKQSVCIYLYERGLNHFVHVYRLHSYM